jgi:3-deoxy-manno-octulosonate cytidylyltransferase (CMP-KDO synthetase)
MAGEPMLAWVYRAAKACAVLDEVIVATDNAEVQHFCDERGWRCLMTSPDLPSGTDRLYAVSRMVEADIYVNIQGDEPLLLPDHITAILALFTAPHVDVTTPKVRCTAEDIGNPNAVKVVTALDGRALYFSRATIPFDRDGQGHAIYWKHLGLYAYRKAALERFASLPPSALEQSERLEQLRLLENGISIYVAETADDTIGVDTEDDLRRVEAILLKRAEAKVLR